jgi:rRNA-processing protein FCF1
MTHALLFPDSNVFLQCKALDELPWSELLEAEHIDLLIGAPVQDEIDRLKNDGNARRARHARDINSLFRQVLASPQEAVTIREQALRIVLRFAPPLAPARASAASLDLKRPDDQLIDEVMQVRRTEPKAQILSDDTGMILRARRHGVPVLAVPGPCSYRPRRTSGINRSVRSKLKIWRSVVAKPRCP